MRRPDASAAVPRTRLLGWFLAVNSLALLAAAIGAGSATADAAHQLALWCGIG